MRSTDTTYTALTFKTVKILVVLAIKPSLRIGKGAQCSKYQIIISPYNMIYSLTITKTRITTIIQDRKWTNIQNNYHLQAFNITKIEVIIMFSFFTPFAFLHLVLSYYRSVKECVYSYNLYFTFTIPGFLLAMQIFNLILLPVTTTVTWPVRSSP